jgi:hypothetical protein
MNFLERFFKKAEQNELPSGEPDIKHWQTYGRVNLPTDVLELVDAIYLCKEPLNRINFYVKENNQRFWLLDFQVLAPSVEWERTPDFSDFHPGFAAMEFVGAHKFSGNAAFRKTHFLPIAKVLSYYTPHYLCYTSDPKQPLVFIYGMEKIVPAQFGKLSEVLDVKSLTEKILGGDKETLAMYKPYRLDEILKSPYAFFDFSQDIEYHSIDLPEAYEDFLNGMMELTHGEWTVDNVRLSEEFETRKGTGAICVMALEFNLNGEGKTIHVEPSTDTIDLTMFDAINNIISKKCSKRFALLLGLGEEELDRVIYCDLLTFEKLRNNAYSTNK